MKHWLILISVVFFSSCGLMPNHEFEQAEKLIPKARDCALKNIVNLTKDEKLFINQNKPIIGRSNYVDYYYWWRNPEGKTLFTVHSGPPSSELSYCRAFRNEEV